MHATTIDHDLLPPATTPAILHVELTLTDPEVVLELRRRGEGRERDEFASRALRLGVLALRQASGGLDTELIKREGDRILGEVRELLVGRTARAAEQFERLLSNYLDPASGSLPQRIDQLARGGGELEAMLSKHLEGERSTLARTLAEGLGAESPIMRVLSPNEKGGLIDALSRTLEGALKAQHEEIVRQFSMDRKDSALARLVEQVKTSNGKLHVDLSAELKRVVREFSLDDDASALARLKKEVMQALRPLVESHAEFQSEVRRTLETMRARREEEGRSTRHGNTFEVTVGEFLARDVERAGDVCESVGSTNGALARKVGDYVIELGPESAAPGARIVVEAKATKSWTEKSALAELAEARANREASVGVFVFDAKRKPDGTPPLRRLGSDVLVSWDAESTATDVYLWAALSLARALAVREHAAESESDADLAEVEKLVSELGRHAEALDAIIKAARTVKKNGGDILATAETIHDALVRQVQALRSKIEQLKTT